MPVHEPLDLKEYFPLRVPATVAKLEGAVNRLGTRRFPINSFRLGNVRQAFQMDVAATRWCAGALPQAMGQGSGNRGVGPDPMDQPDGRPAAVSPTAQIGGHSEHARDVFVVAGGGAFIGGPLVVERLRQGRRLRASDIEPVTAWCQVFDGVENVVADFPCRDAAEAACRGAERVYQLAGDRGGMGSERMHRWIHDEFVRKQGR
jgi:hypothetical protein